MYNEIPQSAVPMGIRMLDHPHRVIPAPVGIYLSAGPVSSDVSLRAWPFQI